MKYSLLIIITLLTSSLLLHSQSDYYFPPLSGEVWEMISPESLNWNEDAIDTLYNFLLEKNSKAFIVLHKGNIVLEKYFGAFTRDSLWYWASAGKTITAFLVGKAQEEGYLSIHDRTSAYLGEGWTSCPPEKEEKITIWNQLTMTAGLETTGVDLDCTAPECLTYLEDAGERWFYHNAPYTLLKDVLNNATGKSANLLVYQYLNKTIGMGGLWLQLDYNNVYFSTARDMARFGLMILANGNWAGKQILEDKNYLQKMITKSQDLNPAYGYLFWLNGSERYVQPGLPISFNGSIIPDAPTDLFAGMGKNDQRMYIVPSLDLVVIRMGNAADDSFLALSGFDNELWIHLNKVLSNPTTSPHDKYPETFVFPNPAYDHIFINTNNIPERIIIYDISGKKMMELKNTRKVDISPLPRGVYLLHFSTVKDFTVLPFLKE